MYFAWFILVSCVLLLFLSEIMIKFKFIYLFTDRTCSEDCTCSNSGGSSSLVVMRPDWPVHRWQTRQMAKAVVDNTINKVIEDMGIVPFDHNADGFLDEAYETFQSPRNPANLEDAAVIFLNYLFIHLIIVVCYIK